MVSTAFELATAYDIGRKELVFCDIGDSIPSIARTLRDREIGSIIVCKDERYAGIVTEDKVLDAVSRGVDVLNATVGDLPLDPLFTVHRDAPLAEVSELFATHGVTRLGVVDDGGKIIAVVKRKNLELLDRFSFIDRMR
jgi:CBS domain-containing protein